MIRCDWFSIACISSILTLGALPAMAQSDDQPISHEAAKILDQDNDSLAGIFDLSRYTFRDLTFYWDNDGTVPGVVADSDRYYTNGNAIELSFNPNLTPALASRIAISDKENQRFGVGIAIKHRIYTPTSILLTNPPARDHPYAGYLALALSFQRADDHIHDHFGLDLGIIGHTSGAETLQKFIHNAFPDENTPVGWDTQLPTEPTINFTFTRTWKTDRANFGGVGGVGGIEMEMLPSLGFDVGTVLISARSSMILRVGKNLPSDFGPATMLGQKDHTVRVSQSSNSKWSIYAYTRLGVDAIARDLFLDGPVFSGSRSAQREPLVATFSFGLITRYKSFYLGWNQNIQSERFDLQPNSQSWGSIVLGCSFDW
ncbi:MAG: lipid A deacylase LpxR family protein [Phycisphaerales bacterium]|nr:lipid A deacylase LpxR family protein [Phycisphaerales bacterium]